MSPSELPNSREFVTRLLNSLRTIPRTSADATNAATTNPLIHASEPVKEQLLALHVLFPNELLPALDLLDRRLVTRFRIRRGQDYRLNEAASSGRIVRTVASTAPLLSHGPNEEDVVAQSDDDYSGGAVKASAYDAALTHSIDQMGPDAYMADAAHAEGETERENSIAKEGRNNAATPNANTADAIYYVRSAQQRSSRYSASFDTITSYEVRLEAWNCSCPAFAFSSFPAIHPEPPVPVYNSAEPDPTSYALKTETAGQYRWAFGGISIGEGMAPVCKHLLACVVAERCAGLFGDFVEERDVSVEEAAGWAAGWGD
jgi:hypothetical protein